MFSFFAFHDQRFCKQTLALLWCDKACDEIVLYCIRCDDNEKLAGRDPSQMWASDLTYPEIVGRKRTIGLILGLRPADERWRYFVATSLIG